MRSIEAAPRCIKLMTKPRAIMGQVSIPKYDVNATKSPKLIAPEITFCPPTKSTIALESPASSAIIGSKNPCTRTKLRFFSMKKSLVRPKSLENPDS